MKRFFFDIFEKPQRMSYPLWLFLFCGLSLLGVLACQKDEKVNKVVVILKTGALYTADGAYIPLGGQIRIGVMASGAVSPLTYIRIDKIIGADTLVQLDKGIYIGKESMDEDFTFSKDTALTEQWVVTLMNADRQLASQSLIIHKGQGSAYGGITFVPSVIIGLQENAVYPHYLDVDQGLAYDAGNLSGHEQDIDIVSYYYVTSGLNSPTLTCPGYTAAVGYYPAMTSWALKNMTLYDYNSSDNNLVSVAQFDAAINDSLLVNAFKPGFVSGNCKYCYTGKVIPFKTQQSKYGLLKVLKADETASGTMEIAIKIQQ